MRISAKFENEQAKAAVAENKAPVVDNSVSPAARNLALAHKLNDLIEQRLVADYTAAARLLGVSQPRLTHLMSLLLLASTIQEAILAGTLARGDKQLRRLARVAEWREQMAMVAG